MLELEKGGVAPPTALFRCPKCGFEPPSYNLARLGRSIFEAPRPEFRVGDDPMRGTA